MPRRLSLFVLVFLLAGCAKHRTRAQGPFNKTPPTPNPALLRGTPPAAKSALVIDTPPAPQSPALPDEASPVPPRPPEATTATVTPPEPPRPPAVPGTPDVVPAGGVVADAGPLRRPATTNPQPAPAAAPTSPASPGTDNPNLAALQKLARTAAEKWKSVDTYEAKLTRRETMGTDRPQTEEVLFQFRKAPMSVYMRNVGEAGRGREVLYNPSRFEDKIHVIVGEGDTRFLRAGTKAPSMSPDSPQVKSKSRHGIREAGFGTTIGKFAGLVASAQSGRLPAGALRHLGTVKRPEYGDLPLEAVEQTVRPGEEAGLDRGGVRQWFFDAKPDSPSHGLPVLVILYEAAQPAAREVEYYCFTQVRLPAGLTDADFDPARLGKK